MTLASLIREAAQALKFNRRRSILTTTSLAWGVACFVILYSYGEGFHLALRTAFLQVGSDLVLMFGGQTSTQAGGERAGRASGWNARMWTPSANTVPMVAAISPEMMTAG
jgi:putative ABC transport system permease protein